MSNFDIKKHLPKVLSGVLSLTILCSMVGVASYSAGAESTGVKPETSSSAESDKKDDKDKNDALKLNKNETVYVIADASGSAKKVIVSDWIENTTGADTFTDVSNLKDVENVKGDETFTINENNMYEWKAGGNDIYYQGTSSEELPVGVNITYKLDGKTVTPDSLAGKSGKVTMRFDYTNRQYEEVKLDGKEEKIYVPFVMMSGMMLDNDSFKNVEVSNGKVINDGSHTYVAGFALPGMQDSLGIESEDFEIPDYVEITADVEDFQLATTLTLAANDMFSNIDFSKLDDKTDDLNEKLDKLTDATDELIDGSSQLYEGINTLLDKSQELIAGVEKLYNGAKKLTEGAGSLDDGAAQLLSGADTLDNGADSLWSGAAQLSNGAYSLDAGVSELQGYIAELSGGLSTISGNSEALRAGAKQVFEKLLAPVDKLIAASGVEAESLTIENYSDVLNKLIGSLSDESIQTVAYNKALKQVTDTVNSQSDKIRQGVENEYRKSVVEDVLASVGYSMTYDQYEAAVAAGTIPQDVQAQINQAVSETMALDSTQAAIDSLTQSEIQKMIDANMNSETVQQAIAEGVQLLKAGREALTALKNQLDNYNKFYEGILEYTAGVDKANAGAMQILGGTYSLKNGSSSLASGASDLKNGASSLKSGTSSLKSGTSDLKDGTSELNRGTITLFEGIGTLRDGGGQLLSGVKKLADGSMTLNKGLKQYKEEGVDVLVDAVNGDLKGLVDRLKAISGVSSNYKSYSGISDDMDGKVDFIFKTDSIETDN